MTQSIGELEDFVGSMSKHDLTNTTLNISQTDQINKTTQGFNKYVKSLMTFNDSSTIVHNQQKDTRISYDQQKRYRSGVGLLLYLVKDSQPKLSDTVRAISNCMD